MQDWEQDATSYTSIELRDGICPIITPPRYTKLKQEPEELITGVSESTSRKDDDRRKLKDTRDPNFQSRIFSSWLSFCTFWSDTWTPEILSCILAIAALGGLLAVLRVYEGKVLQDLPIKISINALVSIFALIIRASLVMPVAEAISQSKWLWFSCNRPLADFERIDLASRGPWGSILLVLRFKSRHLMTLGAWITVAALAIGPFTQQIISYHPCQQISSKSSAQVPRSNNFTGAVKRTYDEPRLNSAMSIATYKGILEEPQDASSIKYNCPTGSCSFRNQYQTLGIGSFCKDISEFAELAPTTAEDHIAWSLPYFENDWGLTIIGNGGDYSETSYRSMMWAKAQMPSINSPPYYSKMDGVALTRFIIMAVNLDWQNLTYTMPNFSPLAVECQLDLEIQTLRSDVKNHSLDEAVLSTTSVQWSRLEGYWYLPNDYIKIADSVLRDGAWEECTPSSEYSEEFPVRVAVVNGSLILGDFYSDEKNSIDNNTVNGDIADVSRRWYASDCVWTLDYETYTGLAYEISRHFDQQVLYWSIMDGTQFPPLMKMTNTSHIWMDKLFANGTTTFTSISTLAANLAASMTTMIRNWGERGQPVYIQGEAYTTETCIKVEWLWVSFPASLVALTIVFLTLIIWSTPSRRTQQGPWKSSSLAVLFHGLDERVRDQCGDLQRKSEMLEKAEELRVRIFPSDENSWRLK